MAYVFGGLSKKDFDIFQPHSVFQEKFTAGNSSIFFRYSDDSSFASDKFSSVKIIADAVFYNRKELMTQLNCHEEVSDSYLILQAYLTWGNSCVDHFIGEYVFIIWDPNKNNFFMARGPFGNRVLFYGFDQKKAFYYGNAVHLLFENNQLNKTINLPVLADWLTLMDIELGETFFTSLKRLPPGHTLFINADKMEPVLNRYWFAERYSQNLLTFSSDHEYYTEFGRLYQQVIADRLKTNKQIACDLSGGLDSSSVTCMAAYLLQKQNRQVNALSHVPSSFSFIKHYDNWNYDDRPFMEAVARQYENISLHYIQDEHELFFSHCDRFHPWLDFPVFNPCNMTWVFTALKKAHELGVSIILTGEAGNFTLSWSGLPDRSSLLDKLYSIPATIKEKYYQWLEGGRRDQPWKYYSAIHPQFAKATHLIQRYKDQIKKDSKSGDWRVDLLNKFDSGTSFNVATRFLYGINYSDPTVDRRIIEFCLRTPPRMFRNEEGSRLLVRKGMGKLMPQIIRERTCRGLQAADWYQKIDRQKFQLEAKLKSWKKSPIADFIDIDDLLMKLSQWDYQRVSMSSGLACLGQEYQYRHKLLRAIEAGIFIERYL